MRIQLWNEKYLDSLGVTQAALVWMFLAAGTSGFSSTINAPLYFEANQGQTDARVKFVVRTPNGRFFLTQDGAAIDLRSQKGRGSVVRMKLAGASQGTRIAGLQVQRGKLNYFLGNDPHRWHLGVPVYAGVKYTEIYPRTDLLYHGNGRDLEYDFALSPGGDPKNIRMQFSGAALRVDTGGDLIASTADREVRVHRPLAYQQALETGERQSVDVSYRVHGDTVSFSVGSYDRKRTLVIDPTITYSTYLGGSDDEGIFGIKFDDEGNIYVAGETSSVNFPVEHPIQPKVGGDYDCFVSKFDSSASRLIYSTYLGGSSYDHCASLALDALGSAYVAGITQSADFPTAHPLQSKLRGKSSAFIARLSSDGSELIFSTYLGGSGSGDQATDIALDGEGNAFVTGFTNSRDFPITKGAFQTVCDPGSNQPCVFGDAFVSKISASGQKLIYSTYLGGAAQEFGTGIAVDRAGAAYITGQTLSTNFPVRDPYQKAIAGPANVFLTKLDRGGCALEFSTYLGGNGYDASEGIAIDEAENIYLTGYTSSTNFPLAYPYQSKYMGGFSDGFVTKFAATGRKLIYSTYLGGAGMDIPWRIAVDHSGNAAVIGFTSSTNFPVFDAFQSKYAGGNTDAFVAEFDPDGSPKLSSYLGGKGDEYGYAINADQTDSIWVGGSTSSRDFPLVKPFQKHYAGGPFDAFLTKISVGCAR